jgi:DNA (cytosine-5)-methyltransferase 1
LFFDVARIAKEHKPSVMFLENVRNFAQHDGGKTLKTVRNVLEDLGYVVFHKVMNAAEYGFATARQRIYIVAFRNDVGVDPVKGFSFPEPVGRAPALKNFLEKNIEIEKVKVQKSATLPADRGTAKAIADFRAKRPSTPVRIGSIAGGGQGDRVYSVEGPAITLSAYGGGNAAKTGAYLVDGVVRKLTPRECANVMGFPKKFKLPEKANQAYKQFGNSVVVGVIKAIGSQIDIALANATPKKKAKSK